MNNRPFIKGQMVALIATALASSGAYAQGSSRGGIGVESASTQPGAAVVPINVERTLAITEVATLQNFSLRSVMTQLSSQMQPTADRSLALRMFQQLWSTAASMQPNDSRNTPRCNNPATLAELNGNPYTCNREERFEEFNNDAFSATVSGYKAIGLFNRFDLAPSNGANCGEYRIIFARNATNPTFSPRNFIIFEAVLPNPKPEKGLNGCVRVAEFWRDLTLDNDRNSRISKLKNFYFAGLPGFAPVVHYKNYGLNGGQVRTNQFMDASNQWLLREFRIDAACAGGACSSFFRPATVKTNPQKELFTANTTVAQQFQDEFVTQVPKLAVNDLNRFDYTPSNIFNAGDSFSGPGGPVNVYAAPAGAFRVNIQNKLSQIGSNLTPESIVARAQALSCGGCHFLSNNANLGGQLTWPSTAFTPGGFEFVHVNEQITVPSNSFNGVIVDGQKFRTSPSLNNVFLPHRKEIIENFLSITDSLPRCVEGCETFDGMQELVCSEICN